MEVILSQVSVPDILVFPVLVLAYLWVVGRVILDFVQSNPKVFIRDCEFIDKSTFQMKIGHVYFTVHNFFFQDHDVHNPKCLQIVLIIPIGSMYAIFPCNWLILELDLALTLLH